MHIYGIALLANLYTVCIHLDVSMSMKFSMVKSFWVGLSVDF